LIIFGALVAGLLPVAAFASGSLTKRYEAHLTANAVVPRTGPPRGKGTAHFALTGQRLCWTIAVSGIDKPIAARIHSGDAFSTGPVIARLGTHYKPAGCTTISYEAFSAITNCRCGNVYVDVQTRKFPKGAIRGALENAG
jgi:hypothetical protein